MAKKYKVLEMSNKNLTKFEQEARLKAQIMSSDGLPELQKTPPKHLDSIAKNEYKRIIESLGTLPLRNLDRVELENYCLWYSVFKKTSLELAKNKDFEVQDKLINRLDKATKNIKSLASDLGLNVNSRMQMNMPKAEEKKQTSISEMFG